MTRLGLIGYSNNQGLGVMNQTLMEQFDFNAHLIIPGGDRGTDESLSKARTKILARNWTPSDDELAKLFDLCNTIVTVETDYRCNLFEKARAAGIKTVFIPMWEWFEWGIYKGADKYVCTSRRGLEFLKENCPEDHLNKLINIPWPIDTDKFRFRERGRPINIKFIHNAGFGGLNWRKGTIEAVKAFNIVENKAIKLHLRSQKPIEEFEEIKDILKNDDRIIVDNRNWVNNYEMYDDGDVYLYPARYDGQALVAAEAMACGMPVIVTDAAPMNEFTSNASLKVKCITHPMKIYNHEVGLNVCDLHDLVEKIEWAIKNDLRNISKENRNIIEEEYSWKALHQKYEEIFCE